MSRFLGIPFKAMAVLALIFGWSVATIGSASAQSDRNIVEQAKTDGIVGEMANGYLGFRVSAVPDNVRRAVNRINLKRKSVYTNAAKENNVSVEVTAALTAEKLIGQTGRNEWYRDGNGTWVQRQ